jgi:carboxyl-terminal processing protease
MRVLILDLRGNPGGLFLPAVRVAERFLSAGVIVSTQSPVDALNRSWTSTSGMAALDVPLVLLVDGETASAAEVVAGAFKDHNRALLVGQPTFGKGTTQFVFRLADESDPAKPPRAGAFKVTRERLFSPSGQALSIFGVVPHYLEPMKDRQLDVATEHASRLLAMKP